MYAVPPSIDLLKMEAEEPKLPEVPRERLKFQEKLGEGQFGEVHLCEVSKLEVVRAVHALRARIFKNSDCSTGSLARPFTRSLAPLTSLTPSLVGK